MVRQSFDSDEDVSLFPFMSIIACIIGTLTLVIATQTVTQLDNSTVKAAEGYDKAKAQLATETKQVDGLKSELQKKQDAAEKFSQQEQDRIAKLQQRLQELSQQIQAATEINEKSKAVQMFQVDLVKKRENLEVLQKQLGGAKEQVAQLEKQISDKKLPPEESQVTILPTGSGVGTQPSFVECDANRLVVHTSPENYTVRLPELNSHDKYLEMLSDVKSKPGSIVIFLIRQDGLSTYHAARNHANQRGVDNGKIPIIGQGRIDLSYYTKTKK